MIQIHKDLPTKDICGASKAQLSHAYLMTPNFPSVINAGTNCDCVLSTNYEKGQILLRRVDMKVQLNKYFGLNFILQIFNKKKFAKKISSFIN